MPICVISAGVKSILDIGKTLEYLETQGVLVMAYKTKEFPSFYTRESGFKCNEGKSDSLIAEVLFNQFARLKLDQGVLLANPVPKEFEMEKQVIDQAINEALK